MSVLCQDQALMRLNLFKITSFQQEGQAGRRGLPVVPTPTRESSRPALRQQSSVASSPAENLIQDVVNLGIGMAIGTMEISNKGSVNLSVPNLLSNRSAPLHAKDTQTQESRQNQPQTAEDEGVANSRPSSKPQDNHTRAGSTSSCGAGGFSNSLSSICEDVGVDYIQIGRG